MEAIMPKKDLSTIVDSLTLPKEFDDALAQVLLKEKEYVDNQISANLESNIKILGAVATAVVAGLGWIFSKDSQMEPDQVAAVLLALATLSGFGSLIGTVFNGFSFSYIAYKSLYLGPLLERLLNAGFNPLLTSGYISMAPGQKPIVIGTLGSGLSQIFLNWGLFLWAANLMWRQHGGAFRVPGGVLYFVGFVQVVATIGTFSTIWAMFRTRRLIMAEFKGQRCKATSDAA